MGGDEMSRTDPRPHYGLGRRVTVGGYVDLWDPQHPLAKRDGYVSEHRKVAWDAGLMTDRAQHVHHRNGEKADNRPENLEVTTNAVHARAHAKDRGTISNQFGTWPLRPPSAPRPMGRLCATCHECIDHLRLDAIYCSSRCRTRNRRRDVG